MDRKKKEALAQDMTPDEEQAYWDAQDPLRQGKKVRIQYPQPSEERLSYFALRLRGKDIERLAELARLRAMKPSELARTLILQGLERKESQQGLTERVAALEREVGKMRKQLIKPTKREKTPNITSEPEHFASLPVIARGNGSSFPWKEE